MWDMWLSGGIKTINNLLKYNINKEEKNVNVLIWSSCNYNVVEWDTIDDSECVFASYYSLFWIVFVDINKDTVDRNELKYPCNEIYEDWWIKDSWYYFNDAINCAFINTLSEPIIIEDIGSGDIQINFLAYFIEWVLQIESKKNSDLKWINLSYYSINDKLDDENYFKIYANLGDDIYFSSDKKIKNKKYEFNINNYNIIININTEEWIIIDINNQWIKIKISKEQLENSISNLVSTLNNLHSDPWCE